MAKLEEKISNLIASLRQEVDIDAKMIAPRPPGPKPSTSDPVIFSDELKFLNSNWNNWSDTSDFSSHRPLFGKVLTKLKIKLQSYLFSVLFKDYFDREREFVMKLVQFSNLTARYIDSQNEHYYWKMIEKIDKEIDKVNLRNDAIFSEIVKNRFLDKNE